MSDDVSDIRERIARMEEKFSHLAVMMETSLSHYSAINERVSGLERLKAHFYFAAAVVGVGASMVWQGIKLKIWGST
jgi:hypothetical protein